MVWPYPEMMEDAVKNGLTKRSPKIACSRRLPFMNDFYDICSKIDLGLGLGIVWVYSLCIIHTDFVKLPSCPVEIWMILS